MAKKSASKEPPKGPKEPATKGGGGKKGGGGGGDGALPLELDPSLEAEARRRYLNYAPSVITSRALRTCATA